MYSPSYHVFTGAGKPVYCSNANCEDAQLGGVVQALLAHMDLYVQEASHSPSDASSVDFRVFKAASTTFVALHDDQLIFMVVDSSGFSESQLKFNLRLVRNQILSTITQSQLSRAFAQHPGLDLRLVLSGNDPLLNALIDILNDSKPECWLSALESLKLVSLQRQKLHQCMIANRCPTLLYGLILADRKLVSVIRPQRHSLHPLDMQLIVNLVFNSRSFVEGEHWVPICLPEFNNSGFLYAYITFMAPQVALVLLSPERASFFKVQEMGSQVSTQLSQDGLISEIVKASASQAMLPADIGCPLIDHFIFKSHKHVQFWQSTHTEANSSSTITKTMYRRYQHHQARAQSMSIPLLYARESGLQSALFRWMTPSFEIFCTLRASVTKKSLNESVNAIVSWIRRNEQDLFVVDGATF